MAGLTVFSSHDRIVQLDPANLSVIAVSEPHSIPHISATTIAQRTAGAMLAPSTTKAVMQEAQATHQGSGAMHGGPSMQPCAPMIIAGRHRRPFPMKHVSPISTGTAKGQATY